jgi:hypothetical protein
VEKTTLFKVFYLNIIRDSHQKDSETEATTVKRDHAPRVQKPGERREEESKRRAKTVRGRQI